MMLLTDGRWTNSWNAENRLVTMETLESVSNSGVPRIKLEFAYDHQGRRMKKTVYSDYSAGTYSTTNVTTFLYDGWLLVCEMIGGTGSTPSATNYYTWGLDLFGSFQGVGGIGGLLGKISVQGSTTNGFTYAYDANGNVATIANANDGAIVAHYEYDAFGSTIRATGSESKTNKFCFSTKYKDEETGLYYYGYRYYNPTLGRWPSRDPLEEKGALLLRERFDVDDSVRKAEIGRFRVQLIHLINAFQQSGTYRLAMELRGGTSVLSGKSALHFNQAPPSLDKFDLKEIGDRANAYRSAGRYLIQVEERARIDPLEIGRLYVAFGNDSINQIDPLGESLGSHILCDALCAVICHALTGCPLFCIPACLAGCAMANPDPAY